MDVSEKWGNDVDTAVDLALAELKATRDEVEVTVLEQPSKGFSESALNWLWSE